MGAVPLASHIHTCKSSSSFESREGEKSAILPPLPVTVTLEVTVTSGVGAVRAVRRVWCDAKGARRAFLLLRYCEKRLANETLRTLHPDKIQDDVEKPRLDDKQICTKRQHPAMREALFEYWRHHV